MKLFKPAVHVTIHRAALDSIFDECDRYDQDETGGRLLGTYKPGVAGRLSINVSGVIGPGPNAKRTATYFQQDGEHQEGVFRQVERQHPEIEHLGNWHTHHVNGYPTLSEGDRATYHRVVNHPNHNINFFYALLVTAKNSPRSGQRYAVKHFVLFRDDSGEYEIPASKVSIVDRPLLWPAGDTSGGDQASNGQAAQGISQLAEQRAGDKQFFERLNPGLRSYLSKTTGTVYWRGPISLVDESEVEIVVAEVESDGVAAYGVVVKGPAQSSETAALFAEKRFMSAREAVISLERQLNREIFRVSRGGIRNLWM